MPKKHRVATGRTMLSERKNITSNSKVLMKRRNVRRFSKQQQISKPDQLIIKRLSKQNLKVVKQACMVT